MYEHHDEPLLSRRKFLARFARHGRLAASVLLFSLTIGTLGFHWLAGQGGYGIQSAPGLSRYAAALIDRRPIPADIAEHNMGESDLLPGRFSA